MIRDALAEVGRGSGTALMLIGPAGIGKTSLLHVAGDAAERAGFAVASAVGSPMETGLPFGLIGQAILALGGEAFDSVAGLERLEVRAARLYRMSRWLSQRAADRPLLLALDDLQWADPDSLELLGFLCRRVASCPIMVLGCLRPDSDRASALVGELIGSGHARLARLDPLSQGASAALITRTAGRPVDARQTERLWRACAGTPLLLRAAAQALSDGGVLWPSADQGGFGRSLLLERFVGAGGEAFAYVQAGSILGVRFQPALAGALAGLDDAAAHAAHVRLVRARLLEDLGGGWSAFVHPLFAQALLEFQPASLRERLHAEAFRRLVDHGAPAAVAAEQAIAAGLVGDPLAIEVMSAAGRAALSQGALEAAREHLAAAVEFAGEQAPADLLLDYVRALTAHSQIDEARRACARLLARDDLDQPMRAQTLALLARASSLVTARPAEAEQLYEQAAHSAAASGAASEGWVRADAALTCQVFSPVTWTARTASGALRTLAPSDPIRPHMELLVAYTGLLRGVSSGEESLRRHVLRAVERGEVRSHAWDWTLATTMLNTCKYLEQPDWAAMLFERAFARAVDAGTPLLINALVITYSEVVMRSGRPREALELVEQAAALTDSPLTPWRDLALAVYLSELGRDDDARPHIEALEALRARVPDCYYAPVSLWLDVLTARRLLLAGDSPGASDAVLHAAEIARRTGWRHPHIVPWASAGIDAHLSAGRSDRASELIDELERLSHPLSIGWPRALVLLGRARVAAVEGHSELADISFERALAAFAELPFPIYHAEALVSYGSYLRRTGRPRDSRQPLADALALCEEAGAERVARLARAELAASGGRRRRRGSDSDELTPQELRVAALAAEGLTNAQIGSALHLSPKTIGHYLERIYPKLGVRSRRELAARVGPG
jgi:DNA-binding CsgD family transcriptional regulator/tetratricopeptide (TPR) repeat protein